MTYAGAKHQPVAVCLVEYQAFEDARLPEVIVQIVGHRAFREGAAEEDGAVHTRNGQRKYVVNKLLPRLVLHHRQRVGSLTGYLHVILLAYPVDVAIVRITLHPDGSLWFHLLHAWGYDVFTLFLASTGNRYGHQTTHEG